MTSTLGAEPESATTNDAFLGGRLQLRQPAKGYRAGVDAVLLAAAVPAQDGEHVLELGCGVGAAALCLSWRTKARVTGLELQASYAALGRQNAVTNGLPFDVIDGDLRHMPDALRAQSFDHVMANPPYYDRAQGTQATDTGRESALGEAAPLRVWVDAGVKRLKPKGRLTIILQAQRLPDLLAVCDDRLGDLAVLPIVPREGRKAELVILSARKGARGPFQLKSPLVMHEGAAHDGDRVSYRAQVDNILRNGAPLASA